MEGEMMFQKNKGEKIHSNLKKGSKEFYILTATRCSRPVSSGSVMPGQWVALDMHAVW